jgi:hypothetical protein
MWSMMTTIRDFDSKSPDWNMAEKTGLPAEKITM